MVRLPHPGRRFVVEHLAHLALLALLFIAPASATAEPSSSGPADTRATIRTSSISAFIAEASARFSVPERWIRAVMQAESAGDPRAVSRAGAMGLMQIMPGTWTELRARYWLGSDPFDPRDNILAGTAYLREMYDRFGSPGFLAAYNAGPARYAEYLATGRSLPRETRAYMATLAPLIGGSSAVPLQSGDPILTADWRAAPLFVTRLDPGSGGGVGVNEPVTERPSRYSPNANMSPSNNLSNDLFVRSRSEGSE